jgi:hypothetical protein
MADSIENILSMLAPTDASSVGDDAIPVEEKSVMDVADDSESQLATLGMEAAAETDQAKIRQQTTMPNALTTESPEYGKMGRLEFLMRGGLGNTVLKKYRDSAVNSSFSKQKKIFSELYKQGLEGAKKIEKDAIERLPGIREWIPKPEYFVSESGGFDAAKWHSAMQLGLYKYKLNQAKSASKAKATGIPPNQYKATSEFLAWWKQNPSPTTVELTAEWTRISGENLDPVTGNAPPVPAMIANLIKGEEARATSEFSHENALKRQKNWARLSAQIMRERQDKSQTGELTDGQIYRFINAYDADMITALANINSLEASKSGLGKKYLSEHPKVFDTENYYNNKYDLEDNLISLLVPMIGKKDYGIILAKKLTSMKRDASKDPDENRATERIDIYDKILIKIGKTPVKSTEKSPEKSEKQVDTLGPTSGSTTVPASNVNTGDKKVPLKVGKTVTIKG